MLWPFDPLSDHAVFFFTLFGFETCNFASFFQFFLFWHLLLSVNQDRTKYGIDKCMYLSHICVWLMHIWISYIYIYIWEGVYILVRFWICKFYYIVILIESIMSDQRLRLRIQAVAQRERNWSFQQPFDIFQCSFDWICIFDSLSITA